MLELSDAAVEAIRTMGSLRLSAHEDGDEIEIAVEAADDPAAGDETVEREGARVFLDSTAATALSEQVLEIEPHGDHVHFAFSPQSDG
jgi:iron-sulfur cluster assembly protein